MPDPTPSDDEETGAEVAGDDSRPEARVVGQPAVGRPPGLPTAGTPGPAGYRPPIPGATAPMIGMTPWAPTAPRPPVPGGRVAPVAPPGWHADPRGRHQYRWFDGSHWTQHVGDDGVASIDEEGT